MMDMIDAANVVKASDQGVTLDTPGTLAAYRAGRGDMMASVRDYLDDLMNAARAQRDSGQRPHESAEEHRRRQRYWISRIDTYWTVSTMLDEIEGGD